jgi:hypothetical protein
MVFSMSGMMLASKSCNSKALGRLNQQARSTAWG